MSRTTIAGVDVGGGGVRLRVEYAGTSAVAQDAGSLPRTWSTDDLDRLARRIAALIERAAPGVARFDAIAVGLAGLPGLVEHPELLRRHLRDRVGVDVVVVAGDALTTHVGALEFRAGVVVAAGTGAIALGTDLDGIWNQADGWGQLLGDHGGGAWVGRRGLAAALRAHDGRIGGSALLLERLKDRFGPPSALLALVHEARSTLAHELASFAPSVAAAAAAGDPVAAQIWQSAGRHLGQSAVAAATGLDPVVSWGGRLFDVGDLLLVPFRAAVLDQLPEASFVPPRGTSVDGALALARAGLDGSVASRRPYLHVYGAASP
jgi:N-acetylglucosamine kinase-like BadF-type ATPase